MPPVRSGSLESLRERNRRELLDALARGGSASRADLARLTGLSRSTVSTLVSDLQASGLVVEQEPGPRVAQQGRPPTLLTLDRSAGLVLGVDFGHEQVHVAIADLARTILAERVVALDVDTSAGRAIDVAEGAVHAGKILPGWVGVRPGDELSARLGLRVHLDNDANLGALAEVTLGAGIGARDAVYLMVSGGIGAGPILGGEVYRGTGGTAGELGHVLVDESGPICRCGNRGCLETLASGPAIVRLVSESRGEDLTTERLVELALAGDLGCRRALADAARVLGRVVGNICNLLNPEMVVVGGDLSAAGELLLAPLREALGRAALPSITRDLEVVAGELGDRANVLGALALAIAQSEQAVAARIAAGVR